MAGLHLLIHAVRPLFNVRPQEDTLWEVLSYTADQKVSRTGEGRKNVKVLSQENGTCTLRLAQ